MHDNANVPCLYLPHLPNLSINQVTFKKCIFPRKISIIFESI